jgi:hypothetical protein
MKNGLKSAGRGLAAGPGVVRNNDPARAISVLKARRVSNAHRDITVYLWIIYRLFAAGKAPCGFFSFYLDVLCCNILVDAWHGCGASSDYGGVLVGSPIRISCRLVFYRA